MFLPRNRPPTEDSNFLVVLGAGDVNQRNYNQNVRNL